MSELKGTDPESPFGADGADPRIGTVVDKYTIVRLLGKGGMGAVYEARHAKLLRRFAIKFLLPELAAKREMLRRFENEAKAAGGLEHANLAAVTDFGRADDGAPYIVMEFLQGEDCSRLLHRIGPLPIHRATDIVVQACRGLTVAHGAGIVHRDLKPENLFLADAGDGRDLIKVLDFGIAKLRSADGSLATGTGATFGTAHYMSPEQARGASDIDQRTDVWSLGVVLYELLSGRMPFEGDVFLHVIHEILNAEPTPLEARRAGLPPALVTIVKRAMTKDVARRFLTVAAFSEALAPFAKRPNTEPQPHAAAGAATRTRRTPQTDAHHARGKRSLARSRKIVAAGMCGVVMVTGVLLLTRSHQSKRVAIPASTHSISVPIAPRATAAAPAPLPAGPIIEPFPAAPVRIVSVQSGHGSDNPSMPLTSPHTSTSLVRTGHKPASSPALATPTSHALPVPKRDISTQPKSNEHGLTIDQSNPY